MTARAFPWRAVLGVWALLSAAMLAVCWSRVATLDFADRDDFMRLLQVRDLLDGQGWYDLTQHRIAPPWGLAMHWSRIVDLPLIAVIAPLRPLFGQAIAERAAVAVAPMLTLLALMIAVAALVRSLVGKRAHLALLGCLFACLAPDVLVQIHPARIDHHGWQIAFATAAFAAALDRRARRGGVLAGLAAALYLGISIEGAPFVAALGAALAICWIIRAESSERLIAFVASLAGGSVAATALFASGSRWTEGACDAVAPAHLVALALLAPAVLVATRWGTTRTPAARAAALAVAALPAFAALATVAPQCLTDPYGAMLPLVRHYWFENVLEGMPFWRQPLVQALTAVVFPIVGLAGTSVGWRAAGSPELRRRWLVALIVGIATLVTGALVARASGLANAVAVPGALVLLIHAVARAQQTRLMPLRVVLNASAILGLSPLMPVVAAAAVSPRGAPLSQPAPASRCDAACAFDRIATLPPSLVFAGLDLGPDLVARTPHRVYAAGYHRLQRAMNDTVEVFLGSDAAAQAFLRDRQIGLLVFAPQSSETDVYVRAAPDGLAAHLRQGRTPRWLRRVDTGSPLLTVYVRRD